jgi:hypothetical protein
MSKKEITKLFNKYDFTTKDPYPQITRQADSNDFVIGLPVNQTISTNDFLQMNK